MSDEVRRERDLEVKILEQDEKVANAEAQKRSIKVRIARHKNSILDDEEHLLLQDEAIVKAKEDKLRLEKLREGGE